MTNNLPSLKQDSNVALSKTKSIINITNKILAQKKDLSLEDDSWMERLWAWADENGIPELPKEITKLTQLTSLWIVFNPNLILSEEVGRFVFEQIYERLLPCDKNMADYFKKTITFVSYESSVLTWKSCAEGAGKDLLTKNYAEIRQCVRLVYGVETQIRNVTGQNQ